MDPGQTLSLFSTRLSQQFCNEAHMRMLIEGFPSEVAFDQHRALRCQGDIPVDGANG